MYHTLRTIFILLIAQIMCFGQSGKGTIKGRVLSADSLPGAYVPVGLKGTSIGTTTDANGHYQFKAPAGSHTLLIQFVGHESEEKTIEVKEGELTEVENFTLRENSKELQEVIIEGRQNKFADKESPHVSRLPLKDLENPQVYSVVTKELMREQVVTSFDDAVKNAPGLNKLWTSTGRGSDGAAYFALRGFSVQPNMINGIAGVTNGGLDPANMEKIEVIKGPSGTLFGSSLVSYGGLINIVTKKPYDKFGGEVSYTGGSYGLSRVTADVNTPINKDKTALFRVNTAYHYEGSFQDVGFRRSFFVAPSLIYKASKRLTFLFNVEYFNSEGTNPLMVFLNRNRAYMAKSPDELTVDFKRSYTSNDLTIKNPNFNMYGQMSYKLSDKWTAQTNLARSIKKSDGYYQYVSYAQMTNDTLLTRFVSDQNSTTTVTDLQQNFIGDFKVLGLRNRLVLGVDYLHNQNLNNSTAYVTMDFVNTARPQDIRYGQLTQQFVDAKLATNTAPTRTTTSTEVYSAYVSEVLNITNNLLVMASLRLDYFKSKGSYNHRTNLTTGYYEQIALSPKFGAVYQVVKDKVSIFANYMNGFQNVQPADASSQPVWATVVFKPQQANQLEGGVKLDLFAHKLAFTASYYDIYVTNVTRSIPIPDSPGRNYTVQDATQKSKGVELDLITNPLPGLNLIVGWTYNDSKYLRAGGTAEGLRPTAAGPEQLANVWLSYALTKGKLQGLGAGIGGNYVSEYNLTYSTLTGKFVIPAYTVLNASLFYDTPIYRLGLKANNLTDEVYYSGWSTVERQMPVRYMASITIKF
jgi:iron complex outermembrane recepter protein